jgi:PAS domain S-box-containing protein
MARDDTTAGLMKRLVESTAATVDWSRARAILNVSSHEEAVELLAKALVKARDELTKAKSAMALLIHSQSDHAIVTMDLMGKVVSITPQGAHMLGWPVDQIIGKPIDMVLKDRFSSVAQSASEMKRADLGESVQADREHVREDGTTFSAHHALFALIGDGGHVTGFARKIENVTAREAFEIHIEELDATIALLIG